jgi:3-hydroxyisobutyrate dehydrogenase-like beta-hydroxyacid dehydrogenase
MGSAVGAALAGSDHEVLWAGDGRSDETRARAAAAGFADLGSIRSILERADVILSICPPHAALDVAEKAVGFDGIYVDANAISPRTTRAAGELVTHGGARFVDGGIVGPPPRQAGRTRLYLSGPDAAGVAALFADTFVDARVVSADIGAASAVKMAYAGWTKGRAALLLSVRELAAREGVEPTLLDEWALSQPDAIADWDSALASARAKGWRWTGEMEQIADSFAAVDLPDGFHRAAARVYQEFERRQP